MCLHHGAADPNPPQPVLQAVCKEYRGNERLPSYNREKSALEAIRDAPAGDANQAQGRTVWPRLLSANDQQTLLLTQPVVKQMGEWLHNFGCKGSLQASAHTTCAACAWNSLHYTSTQGLK